jgi:predicted nucleic acid-binding protein
LICYLDSSALVKRYLQEPGRDQVRELIADAEALGTVAISRAEVVAALAKAVRLRAISQEEAEAARHLFHVEWHDLSRVDITDLIIEWASDLAWGYGLRGYDSVQLAAALTWQTTMDVPTLVATYDVRLWEAAGRVGLEPYPPDLPRLLESWKP